MLKWTRARQWSPNSKLLVQKEEMEERRGCVVVMAFVWSCGESHNNAGTSPPRSQEIVACCLRLTEFAAPIKNQTKRSQSWHSLFSTSQRPLIPFGCCCFGLLMLLIFGLSVWCPQRHTQYQDKEDILNLVGDFEKRFLNLLLLLQLVCFCFGNPVCFSLRTHTGHWGFLNWWTY